MKIHHRLFLAGIAAAVPAIPLVGRADDMAANTGSAAWRAAENNMLDERWAPSAITLADGRSALIAGGYSYSAGTCVSTADIYDEATNRFIPLQSRMTFPRDFATVSLLPNGRVVIAGGYNLVLGSIKTMEIFDPVLKRFSVLPTQLTQARELFTATTLKDGRILFIGGFDTHAHHTLDTAEIYDPVVETITRTAGRMSDDRFGHESILLNDGTVLVVGGKHWQVGKPDRPFASAEIFDPVTGHFEQLSSKMSTPRDRPTLALLPDGSVLVAGGQNGSDGPKDCDIYDPVTKTFRPAKSLHIDRMAHGQAISGGAIFVAGGWQQSAHRSNSTVEMYEPLKGEWRDATALPWDALDLAFVSFSDGAVLAAGGKFVGGGKEGSRATGAILKP